MGRKSENTILKERIEELKQVFADVSADKMKVAAPLVERLAKMERYLVDLERQVDEVGFVEAYQNGASQSGTKESTASRSYSTVLKNYNALARTLISLLPEDSRQEASDGFDEFLQMRK
jgi:hypothetical protein|nr:MAG TPA: hypothetical protein [Caudoviricetes sp.]